MMDWDQAYELSEQAIREHSAIGEEGPSEREWLEGIEEPEEGDDGEA